MSNHPDISVSTPASNVARVECGEWKIELTFVKREADKAVYVNTLGTPIVISPESRDLIMIQRHPRR